MRSVVARGVGKTGAAFGLTAFTVVVLVPLLWAASGAVHTNANLYTAPFTWIPSHQHWGNYVKAWNAVAFGKELVNSAIVAILISAASVLFGLMAAYGFVKFRFPGRRLMFGSIVAVLVLPFPAIMVPVFSLARSLGMVNSYLGLIVPGLVNAQGVFLMRQYMLSFPDELLEAARTDGAGEVRIFSRIVFPLCWPVIVAVGILTFVGSWNNLLWPLLIVNDQALYTVPLGLSEFNSQFFTDYVSMMALSVVAMLPVICLFLLTRRRLIDSVMLSGGGIVG